MPSLRSDSRSLASKFAPGELGALEGTEDHPSWQSWLREVTEPAFIVKRWRLIIFAFPITFAFLGIRWLQWYDLVFENPLDLTIVAPVTTACVFVCATMLANVVADFKESEKIPAELTGYFQSLLTASLMQAAHFKAHGGGGAHGGAHSGGGGGGGAHEGDEEADLANSPESAALRHVETLLMCVIDFLDKRRPYNVAVQAFINAEMELCAQLEAWGRTDMDHVEHCLTEARKKLCRAHDIARTSIILPLYTLIDSLTLMFLAVLVCAKYTFERTGYATITILGGLFVYMKLLNRDLDDPFQYPPNYHRACYALGKAKPLTVREAWSACPSIDFLCLTVDFGGMLRRRLADLGLRPAVGAGGAPPLLPPKERRGAADRESHSSLLRLGRT